MRESDHASGSRGDGPTGDDETRGPTGGGDPVGSPPGRPSDASPTDGPLPWQPPGAFRDPSGATPPPLGPTTPDVAPAWGPAGPPPPGGQSPWQPFGAYPPPGSPGTPNRAGLKRLAARHFVVPAIGVAVVVATTVLGSVGGGSPVFSSSDEDLCSAYRAAERSWDIDLPTSADDFDEYLSGGYDDFTDTADIERLGSVARKHSDPDVREAGQKIDDLSGMFSYERYSSIVSPIESMC